MPVELSEGFTRFLFAFGGVLIGWAIGFFDSKLRADRKIRETEEKAETAIRQAKEEAERTALAARAALEAAPPPGGKTLLRLWLDSAERPALDLDGQRVETSPLSEPHRKRLLALVNLMRPWIEGKAATLSAPAAPTSTSSPRPSLRDALKRVSAPPPPEPRPVSIPPPSAPPPLPAVPSSPASKDEKPAAPLSIVAQIDEILQARLAFTPLANRAIRLQESPDGGVIVWVGLQKFASVDEVADPEIQAVIRAAIAEWEKKHSLG